MEAASSSWTSSDAPLPDLDTGQADTVGLAVDRVLAVQGHGQDPRRRGLAGAPGPAEQVGVGDPAVPHGVAEGPGDVLLAPHLGEALRAEAPVERLVRLFGLRGRQVGHGEPAYGNPVTANPAARCDGQAVCGTQRNPLRAAAVRP